MNKFDNSSNCNKMEYGDFQTPQSLALRIVDILKTRNIDPESIIEPTCGTETLLEASLQRFPAVSTVIGLEINREHCIAANQRMNSIAHAASVNIQQADFFRYDWGKIFRKLPEPVLVIGNPPWVTNSQLKSFRKNKNQTFIIGVVLKQ